MPDFIGRLIEFSVIRHSSMILSNVPGPLTPFEIGGKEVVTAIAWPPLVGDTGLSIAVFSYAGTLRMSVLSDKAILPNPGKLTEKFIEEFDEMYEYVKNGPTLIAEDSTACKKYPDIRVLLIQRALITLRYRTVSRSITRSNSLIFREPCISPSLLTHSSSNMGCDSVSL
ncbi:hypothetical protein OS493_023001 [Desmophyllum pertusum]|uniref:O-acyltransferase WSD1 C-terminal domain-containing protein n=1 Tax=Desmophyllum pertusum TaxID=174260 RepID=A0A9W9ZB40_9CNID|nr:hypothetical protein OS493_023001 [Desmophyllum pertusum]